MSHVDVNKLKPTSFEEENYDEYEYYNLTDKYAGERTLPPAASRIDNTEFSLNKVVFSFQRDHLVKAGQRRRPVTTPTDRTPADTSARLWRNFKTARRKTRSEH